MKKSIEDFVALLSDDRKRLCQQVMKLKGFNTLPGSLTKHQNWDGGYRDHVTDIMNIAENLYDSLVNLRPLPFTKNDALFILFLHDLNKLLSFAVQDGLYTRKCSVADSEVLKYQYLAASEYVLSNSELNALKYVHGEGKDHNPNTRVMNELAAFVHCCDTISARIWYDKDSYASN